IGRSQTVSRVKKWRVGRASGSVARCNASQMSSAWSTSAAQRAAIALAMEVFRVAAGPPISSTVQVSTRSTLNAHASLVRGEPHCLHRALAHVYVLDAVVSVRDPGPGRVELADERVHHHRIELRA